MSCQLSCLPSARTPLAQDWVQSLSWYSLSSWPLWQSSTTSAPATTGLALTQPEPSLLSILKRFTPTTAASRSPSPSSRAGHCCTHLCCL